MFCFALLRIVTRQQRIGWKQVHKKGAHHYRHVRSHVRVGVTGIYQPLVLTVALFSVRASGRSKAGCGIEDLTWVEGRGGG